MFIATPEELYHLILLFIQLNPNIAAAAAAADENNSLEEETTNKSKYQFDVSGRRIIRIFPSPVFDRRVSSPAHRKIMNQSTIKGEGEDEDGKADYHHSGGGSNSKAVASSIHNCTAVVVVVFCYEKLRRDFCKRRRLP